VACWAVLLEEHPGDFPFSTLAGCPIRSEAAVQNVATMAIPVAVL